MAVTLLAEAAGMVVAPHSPSEWSAGSFAVGRREKTAPASGSCSPNSTVLTPCRWGKRIYLVTMTGHCCLIIAMSCGA
jgi:hypothetical protein